MDKKEDKIPACYNLNPEDDAEYSVHWSRFLQYRQNRDKTVRFFNKGGEPRNIIDYVKDSVDRMNEYHLKPDYKDDWQSNTFDPVTRNKVITILSKLVSARLKAEVIVKANSIFNTADTKQRARIYTDLLDAANYHNMEQEQLVWEMYTGMSEGTVIGFETWSKGRKTCKFVNNFNPDTGEIETESVTYDEFDDVTGSIVPIEEFYPETIWMNPRDFRLKAKRCFRVREISKDGLHDEFGKFKNIDQVKNAGYYTNDGYFAWGIKEDVNPDNYQVCEWFDSSKDEHKTWINGVKIYDGPIEYNHKRLPFWIAISEPIHHQFLYGKSFPDKLMSMQDMNNAVLNNVLDQLFIILNSPTFVDGEVEDLDDNYLEPNKIYRMDVGTKIQKGTLGMVDQTSFQVLQLIKRSMEESSVSSEAQGIYSGGRKTRYEVQTLQENSLTVASLFLQLIESAMQHKYFLRLYNLIQYYSQPSEAQDGSTRFKFLVLDNKKLTNGKVGKKMIQIAPSLDGNTPEQLKEALGKQANVEMGLPEDEPYDASTATVEPILITRDYLLAKDVELDVKIVPNSSIKESATQKKNSDIAFYQATRQDPMFDQKKNAEDFAAAFGKDPDIVVDKEPEDLSADVDKASGMMGGAGAMGGMPAGISEDLL